MAGPNSFSRFEYCFQSMGSSRSIFRSTPFCVPGMSIFSLTCLPTKNDWREADCACIEEEEIAIPRTSMRTL